jgi:hypothetical protein
MVRWAALVFAALFRADAVRLLPEPIAAELAAAALSCEVDAESSPSELLAPEGLAVTCGRGFPEPAFALGDERGALGGVGCLAGVLGCATLAD